LLKLLQPKRPSPKPRSLWSVKRAGLPDAAHTVMIEHRICADDRPARGLRLGDEQTVKWVFVMEGQKAGPHRIGGVDGKLTETLDLHNLAPPREKRFCLKLSDIGLDREFPRNRCGDHHPVGLVSNGESGWRRDPLRIVQPPSQHMGVKQRDHSKPSSRSSSSVSGSNASGADHICPLSMPGMRFLDALGIATSLATGFLPRVMMTSAPSSASLIKRERYVLA